MKQRILEAAVAAVIVVIVAVVLFGAPAMRRRWIDDCVRKGSSPSLCEEAWWSYAARFD